MSLTKSVFCLLLERVKKLKNSKISGSLKNKKEKIANKYGHILKAQGKKYAIESLQLSMCIEISMGKE